MTTPTIPSRLAAILGGLAFLLLLAILAGASCPGCAAVRPTPASPSAAPAPTFPALPGLPGWPTDADHTAPAGCRLAAPPADPGTGLARQAPPVAAPAAPPPALSVPQPDQHYRLRLPAGPTVAGIIPGWFSPVECYVDAEQAAALYALERRRILDEAADLERARAHRLFRWVGAPLLALGALLLILGIVSTIKASDRGPDFILYGLAALAVGAVLILYRQYIGASAGLLILAFAAWAAFSRYHTSARRALEQTVSGLDQARRALGETDWKNKIAPLLAAAQAPVTRATVTAIQRGSPHAAP